MSSLDSLPSPDEVAKQILEARKERALLRRLYRLVIDAKHQFTSKRPTPDSSKHAASKGGRSDDAR